MAIVNKGRYKLSALEGWATEPGLAIEIRNARRKTRLFNDRGPLPELMKAA